METTHRVHVGDARDLPLADDSADLVVTSPPYPMIEMWDETFAALDPAVGDALDAGDGARAHDLMLDVLDDAWAEVARVLRPGGIAVVNVGDATRTVGRFRVYDNHARITQTFEELGFDPLPGVLWRKPANSAAKFMGSGMVPPNAYVTLEREHVLVFRNGERRSFEPGADRRYEAAYFWEERNRWFSDVWTDLGGERQALADPDLRERSAAFPLALPYRLVNMYSVYGDTVLDPFWGPGRRVSRGGRRGPQFRRRRTRPRIRQRVRRTHPGGAPPLTGVRPPATRRPPRVRPRNRRRPRLRGRKLRHARPDQPGAPHPVLRGRGRGGDAGWVAGDTRTVPGVSAAGRALVPTTQPPGRQLATEHNRQRRLLSV